MKVTTVHKTVRIEIEYDVEETAACSAFIKNTYKMYSYTIVKSGFQNNKTNKCLTIVEIVVPEDLTLRNHYIDILNQKIEREFPNEDYSSEDFESHF